MTPCSLGFLPNSLPIHSSSSWLYIWNSLGLSSRFPYNSQLFCLCLNENIEAITQKLSILFTYKLSLPQSRFTVHWYHFGSLHLGLQFLLLKIESSDLEHTHKKLHEAGLLLIDRHRVTQKPGVQEEPASQDSDHLPRVLKTHLHVPYLYHSWGTLERSLPRVL